VMYLEELASEQQGQLEHLFTLVRGLSAGDYNGLLQRYNSN
jgi:hypothetical protein